MGATVEPNPITVLRGRQAAALFGSGKSAMAIETDWFTQVKIDGGNDINNVGIFPLPTGALVSAMKG